MGVDLNANLRYVPHNCIQVNTGANIVGEDGEGNVEMGGAFDGGEDEDEEEEVEEDEDEEEEVEEDEDEEDEVDDEEEVEEDDINDVGGNQGQPLRRYIRLRTPSVKVRIRIFGVLVFI